MKFTKKQHLQIVSIIVILLASVLGGVNLDNELSKTIDDFISAEENIGQVAGTETTQAVVTRVIDGDTIELETGEKVRYIGIDTPETKNPNKTVECFGREASIKNRELIFGKTVTLEKDVSETDRYGRLLRYVYLDGVMINEYLVRQGFAQAISFTPDVKHQDKLREAERLAKEENLGLWGKCNSETSYIQQPRLCKNIL